MSDRRDKPVTRLHVMKASKADKAVILRSGPTNVWQLWLWDMATDFFTPGQFYRGRVDLAGFDISEDGEYVLLALLKGYRPVEEGSWEHKIKGKHTVVSRPPYFTALAYFPVEEDNVRLGGYFNGRRDVSLYGKAWSDESWVRSGCPFQFQENVAALVEWQQWEADGWTVEFWEGLDRNWNRRTATKYNTYPDGVDRKQFHELGIQFQASMSAKRLTWRVVLGTKLSSAKYGCWLSVGEEKPVRVDANWVGFDRAGRALLTRNGQVIEVKREGGAFVESVLADLTDSEFKEVVAPDWALRWKRR